MSPTELAAKHRDDDERIINQTVGWLVVLALAEVIILVAL